MRRRGVLLVAALAIAPLRRKISLLMLWVVALHAAAIVVWAGLAAMVGRADFYITIAAVLVSSSILAWTFRRPRRLEFVCPNCRYNLTGNQSGVCPECGKAVPAYLRRRLMPPVPDEDFQVVDDEAAEEPDPEPPPEGAAE